MNRESQELKKFLDAIHENPGDVDLRKVFADWLDEHDEPELADEQRNFDLELYDAEMWLEEFADQYANGDYDGMIEGALEGNYCFSNDDGPYMAHDQEFWKNIEIVTKKKILPEEREGARFNCSC